MHFLKQLSYWTFSKVRLFTTQMLKHEHSYWHLLSLYEYIYISHYMNIYIFLKIKSLNGIAVSKKYSTILILIDIANCLPNRLYRFTYEPQVSTFGITALFN